jgi:thiamine transporter
MMGKEDRREPRPDRGRPVEALTASALAVALAVVLHQLRLFRLPQGGEVTLGSAVPIWVVARRYGWMRGALAGLATGAILFLVEGVAVHPLEPFLDYGLGWAAMGLAGLTPSVECGAILSLLVRYLTETVSGVLFFSSYAPKGTGIWTYSLLYNSYLAVDGLLGICLLELIGGRLPELFGRRRGEGTAVEPDRQGRWVGVLAALVVGVMLVQALLWHSIQGRSRETDKAKPGSGQALRP